MITSYMTHQQDLSLRPSKGHGIPLSGDRENPSDHVLVWFECRNLRLRQRLIRLSTVLASVGCKMVFVANSCRGMRQPDNHESDKQTSQQDERNGAKHEKRAARNK